MATLIELALKSLLVATATLLLLRLTRRRSAAERSLIAHLGLLALVALPLASLALPRIAVAPPMALRLPVAPAATVAVAPTGTPETRYVSVAAPAHRIHWQRWAYVTPAAGLLLLTLAALLRLFALSSQAEVLVEPVWLSALAQAQRRMGLKSGTALLVSDALPSPVSWGWARPVILLNRGALVAAGDAEAIIAHELAHVVSLDWAKLMLARVATALFWFNPFAWMLAREAHQLREEAADDAVLATAIRGPDYAQLLVGVARHEAKGLLLGAHGVAPGRGSLRRRVGRVLDTSLPRGRARWSWVAGFGTGMLAMAAPLAAVTFTPRDGGERPARSAAIAVRPVDHPSMETTAAGTLVMRQPSGATITIAPPDAQGRRAALLRSPSGATLRLADATPAGLPVAIDQRPAPAVTEDEVDDAIAMKATGVTPAYAASLRAAAPWLGRLSVDDLVSMRAVGVTATYVRELAAAGLTPLGRDDLIEARAVGLSGDYARAMAGAGYRGGVERLIQLRAVGVTPADLARRASAVEPPE